VLPIVLLVMGQAFGVIYFNIWMAVVLGLVLWILDAILYWYGVRTFQRGELIARL
jgi:fatty-acid desaturase